MKENLQVQENHSEKKILQEVNKSCKIIFYFATKLKLLQKCKNFLQDLDFKNLAH